MRATGERIAGRFGGVASFEQGADLQASLLVFIDGAVTGARLLQRAAVLRAAIRVAWGEADVFPPGDALTAQSRPERHDRGNRRPIQAFHKCPPSSIPACPCPSHGEMPTRCSECFGP